MMIKNSVIHMKADCIQNEVSYQKEDTRMNVCVNRYVWLHITSPMNAWVTDNQRNGVVNEQKDGVHRNAWLVTVSYPIWLTKSTLALQSTSNPLRNQLQLILAQDLLPDLQKCIRVFSHHPLFWLPPFVLRFSSILTTNPINLHHSSAFQTPGVQP